MDSEARARKLTVAVLNAQRKRIIEGLSESLGASGATHSLPVHSALFDTARADIRAPAPRRAIAGVHRALATGEGRNDLPALISGQMALWSVLHGTLREVEGPHRAPDVVHTVLALAGDAVDGITGALIDVAQSGEASVAFPGWRTLVELGRIYREFHALNRTVRDLLDTRDPGQMFEVLQQGILGTFHLRSLVIAAVNHAEGFVEVVRAYPASPVTHDPVGWRYDLAHPEILCHVARSGRIEVIDGWDPRYHERVVQPDGSVRFRQRPPDWNEGHTAFFVPILARDRAVGVVCTASTQASRQLVLREIERMQPFLNQVGGTLSIVSEIAERKQAEEQLRKLSWAVEQSPASVMITNLQGDIEYINLKFTQVTGYSIEEVIGKKPGILKSGKMPPEEYKRLWDTITAGKEWRGEFHNRKKNGEFYWEIASISPVKNTEGVITHYLAVKEDITLRKQAEEELSRSREQLRDLSVHLQSIREEERARIAREVHDELGQTLTVLKMDLAWLGNRLTKDQTSLKEQVRSMTALIDATIQTVRRISTELRPGVLDDLGLPAAVEWQAQEFQNRTGIRCAVTVRPEEIPLDRARATAVFRIFQEILTNVARHAHATQVEVLLREKDGHVTLEVVDNGRGITQDQISSSKSLGLIGMRERALAWNGEVAINGLVGKGTWMTVQIPVHK